MLEVNRDPPGINLTFSGLVTGREIISTNEEILSKYPECRYQLWNLLDADSLQVSPEELHTIALQDRSLSIRAHIKKVAIVGNPKIIESLASSYEVFSKSWVGRPNHFVSQTFSDISVAMDWISSDDN